MSQMKKEWTVEVELAGITPIMFDRYSGSKKQDLSNQDKMYFAQDGKTLVMPQTNIMSFLSAQNTTSAPKLLLDSRKYKPVCQAMLSYVVVRPYLIPFTANGTPVQFCGWNQQIYVHYSVARLAKGIPNEKERPTLVPPWELRFSMDVIENDEFGMKMLQDLFRRGGVALGLGTFRGMYGKFHVTKWEESLHSPAGDGREQEEEKKESGAGLFG